MDAEQVNWARYRPGTRSGHYESYYLRANHPTRPLACWLRYTIFAPKGSGEAVGELWAVLFDGETGEHVVGKTQVPMADCAFARDAFEVRVGEAALGPHLARGSAGPIRWDLRYEGGQVPLLLLPPRLYDGGFPKAKSLVSAPLVRFEGELTAGDRRVDVDGWLGSQNHNWGSRHTDRYAFGQVAGFDGAPDSFLEVATAGNRVGPFRTPLLTLLVLRHGGREYAFTGLRQARRRASGQFGAFWWDFRTWSEEAEVTGHIEAPAAAFVGLAYADPPGGTKYCLNTKIASCELSIVDKAAGRATLVSQHGALFELLSDRPDPDVPVRA
jgi:hypothetical protein